jgi:N-acylneuraminate cytidylyltransferase
VIVGLIPARGGSKGIHRKNLQTLGGKTLIEIGIDLLLAAGCEKVYVSSEDSEILDTVKLAGRERIKRPKELSRDESSTDSVILHAIQHLGLSFDDILVTHQITSPLVKVESVKACIKILIDEFEINSAISVYETHPFLWIENNDGTWDPIGHSRSKRYRRQDMGVTGHETGGVYVSRVGAVLSQKNRFPTPTKCISVTYLEALDIDDYDDLQSAKAIYNL